MQHVNVENQELVRILRISNPPNGYLTDGVVAEMSRALRDAESSEASVVVLTGGLPDVFVQHYDLAELHDIGSQLRAKKMRVDEMAHIPERRIDLLFRAIELSSKIVIAAINGNAMGGGLEMALACDFRILQKGDFLLGLPEIHVGQLPGAGGTQRLTRLVGPAKALDLMLHGIRLSPDQAMQAGLGHALVDDALEEALNRAHALAASNAASLSHIKRLVNNVGQRELYEGLDLERRLFLDLLSSEEGLKRLGTVCHSDRDFRTL